MIDLVDIVRDGSWKTGLQATNNQDWKTVPEMPPWLEVQKKVGEMRLQNQILQTLAENNKINSKMKPTKFITVDSLKTDKDIIKINEEDVIKIHVTNERSNICNKLEQTLIPDDNLKNQVEKPYAKKDSVKTKDEPSAGETLLEVVERKQGEWNRNLYILNPDKEITGTIKHTFEAHGCSVQVAGLDQEVQVGGLERDLAYLYVLLDRRVSIKRLRRLMERGRRFGLEFFLTKSGLTSSLLSRNMARLLTHSK